MGWRKTGFTLIELIISISILAILTALTGPAIARFSSFTKLNTEAQASASQIRALQAKAIMTQETAELTIKGKTFAFAPSGNPLPGKTGSIIFEGKFGQKKKVIVSSAGRVRIE
ncbi:MAG: prepilin-type N-terminal cleavage/methylation domain-containing protein [bacterium]